MERDSGAKISIRGKGSVKEGKARPDQYAEDAEEELHCLVIADSEEKVTACVKFINKVIETVSFPHYPFFSSHRLHRQHQHPKAKMIIKGINFANWRLLTVLFETTKIKYARIAVV